MRGGINLLSRLNAVERVRGVIAASTGNHGQSVAYAARLFGVTARIVVPEGANPGKVAAMQGMGAEVIFHGPVFMSRASTVKTWRANTATATFTPATSRCSSQAWRP